MNHKQVPLSAGLYLCAVPIGNARDVTLRTLDILASADVIAAEDTRTARKLMEIHGVGLGGRAMVAYHDHSGENVRARLMEAVHNGKSVAYVSEAGTPLVADPGFKLAADFREAGLLLTAAPGASAVLTALSISGLPSDAFYFGGFLPNASSARQSALAALKGLEATLVLYESPKRVDALLKDVAQVLGPDREVAICRELTKKFEEVRRGIPSVLLTGLAEAPIKGEVVVLIGRGEKNETEESDVRTALRDAMQTMRVKDAASAVAGATGWPKRDVYQLALSMKDNE